MYRKASEEDCEQVYALICGLEEQRFPFGRFSAIYREQLGDSRHYCLVCEREQRVIGVLNMRLEEQLHHCERIAEIMEFAVDSAYRSQGIGTDMFAAACRIARDFGCVQIELDTNQRRTDAHRFYTRMGMRNTHFMFTKVLEEEK